MDFTPSPKANEYLARMRSFIDAHIVPIEKTYRNENLRMNAGADWTEWRVPPVIEALKEKAREAGLWNLFLPSESGLSTLEYAPLAEMTGRFEFSAEVFNCNAPDTGNMEVLHHFGSEDQKEKWLKPLLAGKIRSVFCMSEPDVASSDATNIAGTIQEDGADLVLNGKKWWSTGVGHPNAKLAIFMGVSNPDADPHRRHSMVLVPLDTPGVRITRMLPTFGEYDPPYGHGEVEFNDVRVSKENVILGLGKGFLIAQGRLGPGRIHHSMRAIGAAERALELTILRASRREAFGKPLIKLGGNLEQIANARMAIDQARLLTLYAAWKIDRYGVKEAMTEISAIKVVAPNVLQSVVDHAIQIHGGAGLSHDVPLTNLFLMARALRLADGPDEVHRAMVARHELAKYRVREAEIA
ncbi:acyl-CoA dehydrogenase [Burkholderia aenigmatica]|uniref:Acyl-CoA dehydrogenase n=1 Tax=Burkholderia aenigmatica TaxID=2015348 RepID=A0ABY6XSH1_9BURK|nr:acyl-CoA dehydrogenase family protein [Burkholderia aenigmatica]VWC73826.1 acyl-CoA dehydrogenase [Burkholderia aenigmatica]VWD59713.1 acyl-CoA dehydrogenase [Burkholderia aenigmatica]